MNALFSKAGRQSAQLSLDLDKFQEVCSGSESTASIQGQISASLTSYNTTLRDLDEMIRREISMERREQAKEKFKALQLEYNSMRTRFEQLKTKRKEQERTKAREELSLTHRAPPSSVAITAEHLARKENQTFDYTGSRLDEFISIGSSTLESLRSQRHIVKSTHRRLMDAATSLGVSQSLMRIIERRTARDKYIFTCGVLLTLAVIYFCIRLFK